MSYLLGIDLGTSSVKTVVMDETGNIKSVAQKGYGIIIPKQGYAEQHPQTWWDSTIETIRTALSRAQISPDNIKGIGLSGQMHGMVLVDSDYQVIRPAIIWSDQRTREEVSEMYSILGKDFLGEITRNPVSTGFQTPSLLWVKKHEPDTYKRIYKVLLPKDFIRLRLTGEIGTEMTDASATSSFDPKLNNWAEELIRKLGLDPSIYPTVYSPTDIAGEITGQVAQETGLQKGTPVVYGGGDQPMQAVGNGIVEPGQVSLTIGTGGQVLSIIPEPIYDKELRTHTFCNAVPGTWNIMGAHLAAGLSLSWLNQNILSDLSYEEVNSLVESIQPGSEGLIFLPYLIGERTPHMDATARGTFLGLTLKHNKAHLIRSVMEGVVFALRDSVEIFKGLDIEMNKFIASGGGARSDVWVKIQASMLNQEIYRIHQPEQACVGAAIIAGVGINLYPSIQEATKLIIKMDENPILPDPNSVTVYNEMYELYKQTYQNNKEIFARLNEI